jgi:hypothetical protein
MIHDRTFGVELEQVLPPGWSRAELARKLTAAGFSTREWSSHVSGTHTGWTVKPDGSIRANGGYDRCGELISPPLQGEEGIEQVRKVCEMLTQWGSSVNQSCGLHVHVYARHTPAVAIRKLVYEYARNERVIDSVMAPSRRNSNNHFCGSIARLAREPRLPAATDMRELTRIVGACGRSASRYVKLNMESFWRHGTVEFRHHQGTVDPVKVTNWVLLCLRMVEGASADTSMPSGVAATAARVRTIPTGTKLALVASMMLRENGCTRQEVLDATGWPAISMQQMARQAGLELEVRRTWRGNTRRYVGRAPTVAAPVAPIATPAPLPPTLTRFLDGLPGVTQSERDYWSGRAAHFDAPTTPAE